MNRQIILFLPNISGWFFPISHVKFSTLSLFHPDSESKQEIKTSHQFDGVIKGKDLLTKTSNKTLPVLGLINRDAFLLDIRFYVQLLKKFTDLGNLREGRMVHKNVVDTKYKNFIVLQNTIVNMYAKCGDMPMAQKVFDAMLERDVVSYTVLISGYSQKRESGKALLLFLMLVQSEIKPNQFTFGSALKAAGGLQNSGIGRGIHATCMKCGLGDDVYVGSALVDMYTRCAKMEEAKVVFDGLKSKNEVSWNALIAAYSRKGESHNAVKMFQDMKRQGFEPTHFTCSSVFTACATTGALEQGKWVHAEMMKLGQKLVAFVGNTLIDMYGKAGSIEDAKKVFDRLLKKDVVSWNSMLTAYAQHGLGKETINIFEEMLRMRFYPNEVTFLCVLNACSHSGLLDQGLRYFELMKRYMIDPDVTHYVATVDLMGRAGQLDCAVRFIREMKIEPTAAVWKALLGACRMHKNMELGVYAAEHAIKLDPHDSGPRMLLANIYASAGRLSDAARVRKMMNERAVKKEPACSWVEIENVVHLFVVDDDTHPQRDEIRLMWEKVIDEIKKIGYVPDTNHVFWFVDQQEREKRLQYHSEKLALSFALLNTSPGSPIRIKKNIRVCGDCHTAFKFVSKVVHREIILRDTNRFHHFQDGSCSCGDYW